MALLHQAPGRVAGHLRSAPHRLRRHRAAVQVGPDGVGQVLVAERTQVGMAFEIVGRQLDLAEGSPTPRTLCDRMVETVEDEHRALVGAQSPWYPAVEMGHPTVTERDHAVVSHDRARASWALPFLLRHPQLPAASEEKV